MSHIAWPEIESFYNIRKYAKAYEEILNGNSKVAYRCKTKLHGTNAAIRCHEDGTIVAQSRSQDLINGQDNNGFAKWVEDTKEHWQQKEFANYVIFGEWAGPAVQSGVALSQLPNKVFAIFAARPLNIEDDTLIADPLLLTKFAAGQKDTYVIPWYNESSVEIDWLKSAEELQSVADQINLWVEAIDKECPWTLQNFNISGPGEGLVFYPVSKDHLGKKAFSDLTFKSKGEKHKNIKSAKPAQVDPAIANSINEFVDMVLTDARLNQGAKEIGGFDNKLTGQFLSWLIKDIEKETKDELEVSSLTLKQVSGPLSTKARAWYLAKVKELK